MPLPNLSSLRPAAQSTPQGTARRLLACLGAALLTALLTGPTASGQAPPVRILNTGGSTVESTWTVVTGRPLTINRRHLVLDNGLVRITHPPFERTEQAGHILWVRVGNQWVLAGDAGFGDWTYTGSSFTDPVTNFAILENTTEAVRIELSFHFHRHEYMGNVPFPVKKTVILKRGAYGYRAVLSVPSDLPGEREVGFGGTQTHLFSFTNKMGILWNPFQPPPEFPSPVDYVWIRDEHQPFGDWYGASLAFDNSYYRLVSLRTSNPAGLRTGQFAWGHTGHLIHWAYQGFASYEAFVGAVPYDGSAARRITVQNGIANVEVPKNGFYTIYTRTESGRRHTYRPAIPGVWLAGGVVNFLRIGTTSLVAPIVVPVSNGVDYPEDISRLYRDGRMD